MGISRQKHHFANLNDEVLRMACSRVTIYVRPFLTLLLEFTRKSNGLISTRELHLKKRTWRGLAIILIFLGGHPTTCFAFHILYDASKYNIITNPKERKKKQLNAYSHTQDD